MKKLLSLTLAVLLIAFAALSAAAEEWTYDDFPIFPESNERSPKLPAGGVLTQSSTPTGAFAAEGAEITQFWFYDEDTVAANLASGKIAESEFVVSHYDREDCKYSCIVMSYYAHSPYEVTFTVEESGLYEFRFDCVTDVSGRGAYLQIDDGIYYDAYCEFHWPDEISMYGMTATLAAGEHTFKLYGHETKPTYAQGFAYVLAEARAVETDAPETDAPTTEKPPQTTAAPTVDTEEAGVTWEVTLMIGLWVIAAAMVVLAILSRRKK